MSTSIPPWLVGADSTRVRPRWELYKAMSVYTSGPTYSRLFDRESKDALFGAHDLVVESFLQSYGGRHVQFWANGAASFGKGKGRKGVLDARGACSNATVGLLARLEFFREQNFGSISTPRWLVPGLSSVSLSLSFLLSVFLAPCFVYHRGISLRANRDALA